MEEALKALIGSTIWYRTEESEVNTGIVHGVVKKKDEDGRDVLCGRVIVLMEPYDCRDAKTPHDVMQGTVPVAMKDIPATDIFLDKMSLLSANYGKFRDKKESYKKEMETVEALVMFCCSHHVCKDEHTDWAARGAVYERAKELLHLDIDPDATALVSE